MALKVFATQLLIFFSLSLRKHGIDGSLRIISKSHTDLSQEESGELFECINIYKQPAFSHPLLRDHKIQMKPSSIPKGTHTRNSTKYTHSTLKAVECPEGTVPIRKSQTKDLTRLEPSLNALSDISLMNNYPGQHFAVVKSYLDPKGVYYGSQATFNVVNPKLGDDEASLALISLWNGENGDEHMIQAGWGVAPQLYGDHNTHLTIFWRSGKSGCFNLLCPGFVQVDKSHPMGSVLLASVPNVEPEVIEILIHQNDATKNWWLTYVTTDGSVDIGYWPDHLLPRLSDGAPLVGWGGIAKHSLNGDSPPMGFGVFPDGSYEQSGYFREINVMYNSKDLTDPDGDWETFVDSPNCYQAKNLGSTSEGYAMQYGGPGGACGN